MKHTLPNNTTVVIRLDKLIKSDDKRILSERMSSRMVKCASVLPEDEHIGWEMIVPQKGIVKMFFFGSKSLCKSDLEWITQKTAKTTSALGKEVNTDDLGKLYEFILPVAEENAGSTVGFTATTKQSDESFLGWPLYYSSQFSDFIDALRRVGAVFRVVIGSATEMEQSLCRNYTLRTFASNQHDVNHYIGKPVKARFLLRLKEEPSIHLKSVLAEAFPCAKLRLISETYKPIEEMWNAPLRGAAVLPDYAARIMMMEPDLQNTVVGIEVCEEEMKRIPATHKTSSSKSAVTVGKAIDASGTKRKISIGELDLRRHYQIVGQTGCGKSTMLVSMMLSAIEKGHGLTFFDPHGTTIDTLIRCIPEKYSDKIRVVRIGDSENPVPLNIWDSDDPLKEERTISDLCELFADIFDPNREGFVGPRYERWLSVFAKASIALLGRRASLESISIISQSKDNMKKVADAIVCDYPDLYHSIKNEYGLDNSSEFTATLSWYLCKFQRICSVEQLRKTLGAGANALDFNHSIDTDIVTLIDLASPTIGTHAARIIGTLMMMKLWNAAVMRQRRDKTHLIVVDEASLFQTNPMPRMLAEARKFGIAMVLSHQHTGQLTQDIRDALEANSANFSAFRLSPKDAANAAIRFDDSEMQTTLARMDAFNAITTLSVDGMQTRPFTLETIRSKPQKNGEQIAAMIEQNSIDRLVNPYEQYRALTPNEIQNILEHPREYKKGERIISEKERPSDNTAGPTSFMMDWLRYKDTHKKAS